MFMSLVSVAEIRQGGCISQSGKMVYWAIVSKSRSDGGGNVAEKIMTNS